MMDDSPVTVTFYPSTPGNTATWHVDIGYGKTRHSAEGESLESALMELVAKVHEALEGRIYD